MASKMTKHLQSSIRSNLWLIFVYSILIALSILMLFPFLWMVFSSFKPLAEVIRFPPTLLPVGPTTGNYVEVFERLDFARYYMNTIITSVIPTTVTVLTASLAGYGFAKYEFPGRDMIFWLVLATMMIPYPVTIVPLYVIIHRIGLVDTYTGLIIVSLSSAFGIFLMRQFCLTIPNDLIDAARIDGCTEFRIFTNIIWPLTKPALATLTIFNFSGNWNAYIWPMLVVNSDRLRTLSIAIPLFNGQFHQYPNLVYAASVMAVVPVILVFVFNQRYFTEGIAMSGLKG